VCKAFSVKTHGYDTAKRLAIAERERQLAEKFEGAGKKQASSDRVFRREAGGRAARP
jgi:hypothetical protein